MQCSPSQLAVAFLCALSFLVGARAMAQNWSLYEQPAQVQATLRELVTGCLRGDVRDLAAIEKSCADAVTTIEQFEEFAALSDRAVDTQSRVRRLQLQRASVLLEMGVYKTAFKELLRADNPSDESDDDVLNFMKGVALAGSGISGRFDPAFGYLDKAAAAASIDIRFYALLVRADAWTLLGDYDAASGDLESARRLLVEEDVADAARKRAELSLYRGYLLLDTGDVPAAFEQLDRAVALLPGEASVLVGRGLAHQRMGEREEAVGDYRKAISAGHGFDATAKHRLAWLLASDPKTLSDGAEAVTLASEAVEIRQKTDEPRSRLAQDHYVLGRAHAAAGEPTKALQAYADALDADPRLADQYSAGLEEFGLLPAGGARNPADMFAALRACLGRAGCTVTADQWCGDLVDVPCVKARR